MLYITLTSYNYSHNHNYTYLNCNFFLLFLAGHYVPQQQQPPANEVGGTPTHLASLDDAALAAAVIPGISPLVENDLNLGLSELKFRKKFHFCRTKNGFFLTFSKVQKHIFCYFKNWKKNIFVPKQCLK